MIELINVDFELFDKGWVKAVILSDEREITMFGSRLSDAMCDLIIAVNKLAYGEKESICTWHEEPGQYRWLFSKHGKEITLRILRFDNTFSGLANEKGIEILSGNEYTIAFVRNIIRSIDELKYKYGTDGYERIWAYEFPERELKILKYSFQILKNRME